MRKVATICCTALAAILVHALPAHAQRSDENPVTAAGDAFGTSIGGESVGVYRVGNVRGFSPLAAGNVRLDGLYYDRQAEFTGRLVAGHRIRVGMSALGYLLPSPTGIVDYRIRAPGRTAVTSAVAQLHSFGGSMIEVDAQRPLAAGRIAVGGGAGVYANRYAHGGDSFVVSAALIARWSPAEGTEVLPFWSRIDVRDRPQAPVIVPAGAHLPAVVPRRRYLGQSWTGLDVVRSNYGALATSTHGAWTLRTGVFRSVEAPARSFATLFLNASAHGEADLVIVANPEHSFASTSGEARLSRSMPEGTRLHTLHVTMRARDQQRRYGGGHRIQLGTTRIASPISVDAPAFTFGATTRDEITQWTAGAAYDVTWRDVGELSVGVQKPRYSKTVTPPDGALPTSHDRRWLANANAAVHLNRRIAIYGGVARGLEESAVAPEAAVNRDEAPPAIRTRQADLGVRLIAGRGITATAGGFQLAKPYHALDDDRVFRRLGEVRHRGIEVSLAGEPVRGLSIVAGAVPLDASVSREANADGNVGARPVGSSRGTIIASADYRPPAFAAASFDVAAEYNAARVANTANTLSVPAATVIDVGARFRFAIGSRRGVVRSTISNAFDVYHWNVSASGSFSYNAPRQLTTRVTLDF